MTLKFIATLPLFASRPVVFAEQLASASDKDVYEPMDYQSISSWAQSDPKSRQLVDNVVVVFAMGHTSRREQTQPIGNCGIFAGAIMTQINTVNSSLHQDSGLAAPSADPCR